ncbi:DUF4097 family beta strand repeat-containing protein [Sporosarcina sp. Te-1]|uniref:DUF4097 family beta strand repeat-containing protein n=1 Tax=Sporosarcina sp. Te-1 TaxID=2818390 RepID=UPI001A9D6103|nr:DUF4097 family beta strand repeat-containing protein [Sporosarcina sp. Te-1]QTD42614.1 DUF4097 family beta strand repeat protein [Sporosarcina sp. Te-1]
MTEGQFIAELERELERLPLDERNDILQDIREFFLHGRTDGKSDDEIAASLGSPSKIAAELLASYPFSEQTIVETNDTDQVITIPNDEYVNVDIQVQHGSLTLLPSANSVTTVELSGANERLELEAEVIGDTLVVKLRQKFHWSFLFNFNVKAVALRVFIPKRLYQSIAMKTDNGRIQTEKMLCKSMTAQTDNGRVVVSEVATSVLHAESDNGRIEIEKVQTDQLKAKTDNGRVSMRNVDAETIYAESDNGRIELEDVTGELTATTDNGRIILNSEDINRNIDFQTDNGSIEIHSRNTPTDVTIYAKTGHGRIDVYGEKNKKTVFGAGYHSIKLKTDNGRITVR